MNSPLYLASQSPSRQKLLRQAQIPFEIFTQSADEQACDWSVSIEQLVQDIAVIKMESLQISLENTQQEIYVVTADTLTLDVNGNKLGKPHTQENARQMLQDVKKGAVVYTGFCLDKKKYYDGLWITQQRVVNFVKASLVFEVPEDLYQSYFDNTIALQCSGALAIEGYGSRFLKEINGSYSTIIGLPLFELHNALTIMQATF